MKVIKTYQEIKNTTDYKLALYYTAKNERERILEILDGLKVVYEEDGVDELGNEYEKGEELPESESEWNEALNFAMDKIEPEPTVLPENAFICSRSNK